MGRKSEKSKKKKEAEEFEVGESSINNNLKRTRPEMFEKNISYRPECAERKMTQGRKNGYVFIFI